MLDAIKSFFDASMTPAPEEVEGDTSEQIRLAACALLLELAHADDEFTQDEVQHLKAAMHRQYGLTSEQADELIRLADEERAAAVDLFQFTRLIRDNYSLGQKMVLAEVMWGLVYADGDVSADEEYLMRKVCHLLKLEPGYLADMRKRVEETSEESE